MLVITRNIGEAIEIDGGRIRIVLVSTHGRRSRIGFDAPRDVKIYRSEVARRIREEEAGKAAVQSEGLRRS